MATPTLPPMRRPMHDRQQTTNLRTLRPNRLDPQKQPTQQNQRHALLTTTTSAITKHSMLVFKAVPCLLRRNSHATRPVSHSENMLCLTLEAEGVELHDC